LESLAAELTRRYPCRVMVAVEDMAVEGAYRATVANVQAQWGGVHLLVNTAGDTPTGTSLTASEAEWLEGWNTRFLGYVRATQAVVETMRRQRWGRIVHVVGNSASEPLPMAAVGSAVNAALVNWIKTSALELAPYGITVNGVNPGPVNTGRLQRIVRQTAVEQAIDEAKAWQRLTQQIPLGRVGLPHDIADAVMFFLQSDNGYVTGTTLTVDGGIRHSPAY
jgi:3-oxoacyl-[acyl-carrier protein] reductase